MIKKSAKEDNPKYKATTIIYFISPPPKINCRLKSIMTIKKSNTTPTKTNELIDIFFSNKPKIKSMRDIVPRRTLGTINRVKSVYERKSENM